MGNQQNLKRFIVLTIIVTMPPVGTSSSSGIVLETQAPRLLDFSKHARIPSQSLT